MGIRSVANGPALALASLVCALPLAAGAQAMTFSDSPYLAVRVAEGALAPVATRLPKTPLVARLDAPDVLPGRYGGQLRTLMGRAKDIRMMVVYGYARLIGYNSNFDLVPDILESYEVEEGRKFTFLLRNGHKWSDGHPFTTEDFRYYWEDFATNKEMSSAGPPKVLLVEGKLPKFDVIDETTIRYTWDKPNPYFIPALAAASPLYIYQPAHYLKQFHARYADPKVLEKLVTEKKQRNWVALHFYHGRQYKNDNPKLPTLQPWLNTTRPPSDRFIFVRNPYYHRVDPEGRQLPYIDTVVVTIASAKLIPAKAGSGETDLQARGLSFNNYTFLKRGEQRNNFTVHRWHSARGAQAALYPNLNVKDPVWRNLFRNVEFRRALSLAINRHEINQVIYFGLAREGNNTVLPLSPLFKADYETRWAAFYLKKANKILDDLGLTERNNLGIRLLPDGRPMEIVVETAGESTEQTDILELIHDSWFQVGIKLFAKPLQREVFRNRIFAGSTLVSVWSGLENGVPTADLAPTELAPTDQTQLQWPKWGQFYETGGQAGEPPDIPEAKRLLELNSLWVTASDRREKMKIWHEMLSIHADQVFTIGLVAGVPQPVVVSKKLRNVPEIGLYNWDPGAHFGIHRPDTFWFAD